MDTINKTTCPYCGSQLVRWANPELASWGGEYQLVCFNDECRYFVRGWRWLNDRFHVRASYRFRFDPNTGEKGPLPVWSKDALRQNILAEEGAEVSHAG